MLQLCRLQSNDLPAVRISAIWTAAEAGKSLLLLSGLHRTFVTQPNYASQNAHTRNADLEQCSNCHTAQLCKSERTHA